MKTLNEMLSEEMKNDEFRKEHEAIQPELDVNQSYGGCKEFSDISIVNNIIDSSSAEPIY